MIRVLLANDQALIRAGFRSILERDGDVEVVAEAYDGHEALAAVHRMRVDVVLMDIRMPRLDGLAATTAITVRTVAAGHALLAPAVTKRLKILMKVNPISLRSSRSD